MRRLSLKSTLLLATVALMIGAFTVDVGSNQNQLLTASGKLTLLRVQEARVAPGSCETPVGREVVIELEEHPGKTFGYWFCAEEDCPVRLGMLDLLQDAFAHKWTVNVEYKVVADRTYGVIAAVEVTK